MNNQSRPSGLSCPKCSGLYSSDRCLNCGFVFNPRLAYVPVLRETCQCGSCPTKIAQDSKLYCQRHLDLARKSKRLAHGRDPTAPLQRKYRNGIVSRFDIRNEDLKARHTFPIAVHPRQAQKDLDLVD